MKKIFTLISMALMVLGLNAETLIDFSLDQSKGITVGGTTTIATVKIHTNTLSVSGIKLANGYSNDDGLTGNNAKLTVDGGFKAGDVITIAGAFNNADDTKNSAVDIFTVADGAANVLFTTKKFVNGRLVDDDPVEETYTLEADADEIYLGRNGNTATFITTLKVTRGGETVLDPTAPTTWNFAEGLSDADKAALDADAETWTLSEGYYSNAVALAERNVFTPLMANGAELEFTKGLSFTRDNSEGLGVGRVRLYAENPSLYLNGSANSIKIPALIKGDVVKVRVKGGGTSERSLGVSNVDNGTVAAVVEGEGEEAKAISVDAEMTVQANGDVVLSPSNGFYFYAITVNADLPEATGIKGVKTVEQTNNVIYNLAGQKVNAQYKGIMIQNGKKVLK